ncbi:hypothetical protein [Pelagicoccus sp. SDUM812003]|nr:hypothetical protein [Pelagicoccus sp. SDUM812003]MDQ8201496.1 hypothetical protein [Pelagicoccus sp. SDUM812003]
MSLFTKLSAASYHGAALFISICNPKCKDTDNIHQSVSRSQPTSPFDIV